MKAIIESLMDDLADDQQTYQTYQLPVNQEHISALQSFTAALMNNQSDTLLKYFPYLLMVDNFSPTSVTYLSGTSSGKINLIDDLEIKKGLSYYFDVLSVEAQKKGEVQADFFLGELLPWLTHNVNLTDPDPVSLMGDEVLVNKLILYQSFIENKIVGYEDILEVAKELEVTLEDFQKAL